MYSVHVGNLSHRATEDRIRALFGAYGIVESVKILTDRDTGHPRGFGFVEMSDKSAGQKAIAGLNGRDFEGRTLNVNEARPREDRGAERRDSGGQRRYSRY